MESHQMDTRVPVQGCCLAGHPGPARCRVIGLPERRFASLDPIANSVKVLSARERATGAGSVVTQGRLCHSVVFAARARISVDWVLLGQDTTETFRDQRR